MAYNLLRSPIPERAIVSISSLLVLAMLATVAFVPVVYDTDHFGDTFFILGAAWRIHEGYEPAVDFGHFYGGVVEQAIGWAMTLFGPQVKALDWGLVLLFVVLCPALALICAKRVSRIGAALAFLVLATLLFTRYPLESGESITRLVSTHSFTYNRLGLGLFLIVGLLAALPAASRQWEIVGGLVAGVLLVILALTKPTFVVLLPMALLALLLQRRGVAALSCVGGILVGMLLFDPLGAKWMNSFAYAQASVSGSRDPYVPSLIRKSVQVPLAHPLNLTLVLVSAGLLVWGDRKHWPRILAVAVMIGGGLGMAATMGGLGSLGQMALPLFCFAMIVANELALRQDREELGAIPIMALAVVAAFVLPHVANLVGVTAEAVLRRDRVLIAEGPLAGYLSIPESAADGPDQYKMLVDGIAVLEDFDDVSDLAIVADSGMTFEFALQAWPVPTFPLWPRANSPEFAADKDFLADVDVVMIGSAVSDSGESIQPVLRSAIEDGFALCKQTPYWQVFVRPRPGGPQCA